MSNRSRYGQTVYLPKLKGSRAVPLHRRRLEIESGGNGYDEDWLQRLLFETPEILPIGEIDPAFAPATPLCRELPTAAGPIDLAYMSEEGRLSIVECKLWRNPEARRGAVSQILDYAKEISRWSYDELNDAVCRAARRSGNTNALFDIVRAQHDTLDEATFVDDVARSLTSGRFLLIVVGDGIREGVERIADYLNQSAGIRITFGLVELAIFDMPEGSAGGVIVEPRVLAKTIEIERAVVRRADAEVVVDQRHRAGEKTFVDFSGKKPHIVDPKTGELVEMELFVGTLGASSYTYVEATLNQSLESWAKARKGTHRRVQLLLPLTVQLAITAVAVRSRLILRVLHPQLQQRQLSVTPQLLVDVGIVQTRPCARRARRRKQPCLQLPVAQLLRERPAQTTLLRLGQVLTHRSNRHAKCLCDRAVSKTQLVL